LKEIVLDTQEGGKPGLKEQGDSKPQKRRDV
jgi:hypothetical protein